MNNGLLKCSGSLSRGAIRKLVQLVVDALETTAIHLLPCGDVTAIFDAPMIVRAHHGGGVMDTSTSDRLWSVLRWSTRCKNQALFVLRSSGSRRRIGCPIISSDR
jgi:hypothetical protein